MRGSALMAVIAVGWVALTGNVTVVNLVAGLVIGLLALLLLRDHLAVPMRLRRWLEMADLALVFVWELFASALAVARLVLTPGLKTRLRPAIIGYPLTVRSPGEITLLANLITLTPGTLSVDISPDRRVLYIHVLTLDSRQQLIDHIAARFEKRVGKIFR